MERPYKIEPVTDYHKGLPCLYRTGILCQEGYCQSCQIYRDYAGKLGWEADDATLTADQQ